MAPWDFSGRRSRRFSLTILRPECGSRDPHSAQQARLNLRNRIAAAVRDPNVGSVKRHSIGKGTRGKGSLAPSLARSLVTVPLLPFETQMLAPSKATPLGYEPTAKLPWTTPSLARSLVTVPLLACRCYAVHPQPQDSLGNAGGSAALLAERADPPFTIHLIVDDDAPLG